METKQCSVRIQSGFWSPIRETVRREAIPYQWKALNDQIEGAAPSYCMRNFRVAAGKEHGQHGGCVFQDSDVYKWLEGVAYSLVWHPDSELEKTADDAIEDIAAAQQADGYLDTCYIINGLEKRWTNLMDHHELYCAGHMIEAAVAYYQATGKRRFLDVVLKYVDHIDGIFGREEGKLHGYPGHPVIEMALMRLYGITKDPKHLKLAQYFVLQRGQSPLYFEQERIRNQNKCYWLDGVLQYGYYQADKPLKEQQDAVGHAVRALYLYAGATDVARETNDAELTETCRRLWRSVTHRRMYITGAVGSSEYGEAFTFDYDLPNDTVYGETCASVALVFWAQRMLAMEPKGEYADVMERALYNGVLSGMQLDGKRFFYVNPLEVLPEACEKDQHKRHVKPERQPWFGCACCPPNLVRLLASLENYVMSVKDDTLYLHTYASSEMTVAIGGENRTISIRTDYPWDGRITVKISGKRHDTFPIALHIPSWCTVCTLRVNGQSRNEQPADGYLMLSGAWGDNDEIQLDLHMTAQWVRANPHVSENAGKLALTRGPIVYCLEEADNGNNLHLIHAGPAVSSDMKAAYEDDLLHGVMTITTAGLREITDGWAEDTLYAAAAKPQMQHVALKWIPYYAWANRGVGEMRVWVRE